MNNTLRLAAATFGFAAAFSQPVRSQDAPPEHFLVYRLTERHSSQFIQNGATRSTTVVSALIIEHPATGTQAVVHLDPKAKTYRVSGADPDGSFTATLGGHPSAGLFDQADIVSIPDARGRLTQFRTWSRVADAEIRRDSAGDPVTQPVFINGGFRQALQFDPVDSGSLLRYQGAVSLLAPAPGLPATPIAPRLSGSGFVTRSVPDAQTAEPASDLWVSIRGTLVLDRKITAAANSQNPLTDDLGQDLPPGSSQYALRVVENSMRVGRFQRID